MEGEKGVWVCACVCVCGWAWACVKIMRCTPPFCDGVLCGIVGAFILLCQWNIVSTDYIMLPLPLQATLEQSLQLRVFEKSLVKVRIDISVGGGGLTDAL